MSKAIFDDIAPVYDKWYETPAGKAVDFVERRAVEELFKPRGKKILEIGCGTGLYTVWLAAEGYDLTAVDVSSKMMAFAQEKIKKMGKQVKWVQADITEILDDLESYDGILSMTAFEFIDEPEKVLQRLFNLLTPGGCLVIGVIGDNSLWSKRHRKSAEKNSESVFHKARFYTEEDILSWDLGVKPEIRKVLYFSPDIETFAEALEQEKKAVGNPGFLVARWTK